MVKAVRFSRFGGPEVLEIVDLPDKHPGPGQVRIAVRAAGVNPSDWKKRTGLMDGELPQTMGYEAAGVVDELGEGVADVTVGDRVFGFSAEGAAQRGRRPRGPRARRDRRADRVRAILAPGRADLLASRGSRLCDRRSRPRQISPGRALGMAGTTARLRCRRTGWAGSRS
jgi:hypothetical protein